MKKEANKDYTCQNSSKLFFKKKDEGGFFSSSQERQDSFFPVIQNKKTPNQNLDKSGQKKKAVLQKMSTAFNEDFSNVSINENSSKAKELNALAFTQGDTISFAPGQYDPNSQKGQELLGHELTHVVQQRENRVQPTTQAKKSPVNDDMTLEKEADDRGKEAAQKVSESRTSVSEVKRPKQANSSIMQFRLPTFTNLETVFKDATLSIPESTVIRMISTALLRMKQRDQLLISDPVPDIVKRIFPSSGVVVQSEFEKAVNVSDRNSIYQSVLDTDAPIKAADRTKLKAAMTWAVEICRLTPTMTKQLQRVFGTKVNEAKSIYKSAGDELNRLKSSDALMDVSVNTDYNMDDEAMGLGGWASGNIMHLEAEVAQVQNEKDAIITLIHEAVHLASDSVTDLGYYPPATNHDAFSGETEENKIANAAFFEEFPRRWFGKSEFPKDTVFTPGIAVTRSATVSLEDKAKQDVTNYFRKAWDASVDMQIFLRDIQKNELNGEPDFFDPTKKKAPAMEISKKMDLTLHEQKAGSEKVTQLDIVLAEGVPHVIVRLWRAVEKAPITVTLSSDADIPKAVEQLITDIIAGNNTLLGDAVRDRELLDWLVSKYHSFP